MADVGIFVRPESVPKVRIVERKEFVYVNIDIPEEYSNGETELTLYFNTIRDASRFIQTLKDTEIRRAE